MKTQIELRSVWRNKRSGRDWVVEQLFEYSNSIQLLDQVKSERTYKWVTPQQLVEGYEQI